MPLALRLRTFGKDGEGHQVHIVLELSISTGTCNDSERATRAFEGQQDVSQAMNDGK